MSSEGATFSPGLFTPIFGRVKGETELALAAMREADPLFRTATVRPGAVDWLYHRDLEPYLSQGAVKTALAPVVFPTLRLLWRSQSCPTKELGKFLTQMAMGHFSDADLVTAGVQMLPGRFPVVSNRALRTLAGISA